MNNQVVINEEMNAVIVVGELIKDITPSHLFNESMFYFFKLRVYNKSANRSDTLLAYVPESMILTEEGSIISVGSVIKVSGRLVHSKIEGRLDVSILATEVEVLSNGSDEDHFNEVYVAGDITMIYPTVTRNNRCYNNVLIKHEDPSNPNRYFTLRVSNWNSLAKKVDNDFKLGDKMVVKGKLESTTIKDENTNTSLIVHRLLSSVIIGKGEEEDER